MAIFALGKIAHDSVCDTLGAKKSAHPFKHGGVYQIGKIALVSSYHCSRYNTELTGVLSGGDVRRCGRRKRRSRRYTRCEILIRLSSPAE